MPQLTSVMIRVFPSLEHSTDCVRKPADNFRTFVCVPLWHLWTKHNRAKPMSELASALFSIADAGEFRFARFLYCLWRGAIRDTRKSAHCLRLVGHTPWVSKRGQDTEWDASHGMEEIHEFCFKEFAAVCLFWNFLFSGIPIILLITSKRSLLIATISYILLTGVPSTAQKF